MPISKRSANSFAWLLVGLMLASIPAWADSPAPNHTARSQVEAEGNAAMERLKRAVGAAKQSEGPAPVIPAQSEAAPQLQRRAFEGLSRPKGDPALVKRAEMDIAAARQALAAERERASQRIAQALGLEQPEANALANAAPASLKKSWVAVLFVSSAMPVEVLRTYAASLARVGGVMAFRGMPGGMTRVELMAKLSAQVLRLDPGCEGPACAMRDVQIIVDPLIFRQHGVTKVPALAMITGDPTQPYCDRDENSPGAAHVIYGDAALSGLLEEYGRLGGKEEIRDALAHLARQ
ncbi:type-F conjugative transfer system pilin assembly protein TrbC [Novosphingobium sp. SG751A]|uniref:type-F conjugative transfer system pilin assembly protein TrbC n=1 Tax=Novosphingobium sp. SG751A TaxID=2587000 RepID=UPI00155639A8|nr:type-F conjugative transfer system pilin assembly protein TrbC [Novosphingobium sp. SG751A]NOW48396.1 type-F conjugative transfer system pilin assembly protein TrbC [Novosphingobium sp. SG751A]